MRQQSFFLLMCALTISSCGGQYSPNRGSYYQSGSNPPTSLAPNTPFPAGPSRAVAVLVPLSGSRADIGQILLQAVRLALPDGNGPKLDVLDTAGTAVGAASAARTAIANRDDIIIGPLTSAETAIVAQIVRPEGVPILAFTNDSSQAQPSVWPLGISPSQQIQRLVAALQAQGKSKLAALLPDSDFGRAMARSLSNATNNANLAPPVIKFHPPGMAAITSSIRNLADYADRRGPIEAKIKAARALGTAEGRRQALDLAKTPIPPPPFDALLLGDTGDELQEIAAVLPYYDIDRSAVQIIGPALWANPISGSGSVRGAWFAAPDTGMRTDFVSEYTAKYGVAPPKLADIAFDAASVSKVVLSQGSGGDITLTQPGGFVGTDGWFALAPDGQVLRGLAVYRLERTGPEMIDPAPQTPSALTQ